MHIPLAQNHNEEPILSYVRPYECFLRNLALEYISELAISISIDGQ